MLRRRETTPCERRATCSYCTIELSVNIVRALEGNLMSETVTKGLIVRFDALPGKEDEVAQFLDAGLPMVQQEPATIAWFGLRLGPSTFGIFDVFPDEDGRTAHLNGQVAAALGENTGKLFGDPVIEQVDVQAFKLPG